MTHAATAGVSSCATFSIGGFKGNNYEINEAYKADPKSFKNPDTGMSVDAFYQSIILPTSQPLGRTYDMPFRKLMEHIDNGSLNTKFILATLNHEQFHARSGYWPKELRECGFELVDKTKNTIGSVNYIFVRNKNKVEIKPEER